MSVLDLYQMSNLSPLFTGLPFVVWISPRGRAKHDVRIKVTRSARAIGPFVSVALRPHVRVVTPRPAFKLSASELNLIQQWVDLNQDTLLGFWNGRIQYTEQALAALQPLSRALPRVIRTEAENEEALAELEPLLAKGAKKTPEERRLAELLTLLIENFEKKHYTLPKRRPGH